MKIVAHKQVPLGLFLSQSTKINPGSYGWLHQHKNQSDLSRFFLVYTEILARFSISSPFYSWISTLHPWATDINIKGDLGMKGLFPMVVNFSSVRQFRLETLAEPNTWKFSLWISVHLGPLWSILAFWSFPVYFNLFHQIFLCFFGKKQATYEAPTLNFGWHVCVRHVWDMDAQTHPRKCPIFF